MLKPDRATNLPFTQPFRDTMQLFFWWQNNTNCYNRPCSKPGCLAVLISEDDAVHTCFLDRGFDRISGAFGKNIPDNEMCIIPDLEWSNKVELCVSPSRIKIHRFASCFLTSLTKATQLMWLCCTQQVYQPSENDNMNVVNEAYKFSVVS